VNLELAAAKFAIETAETSRFADEIAAMLGRPPLKKAIDSTISALSGKLSGTLGLLENGAHSILKGIPELRDGFLAPGIHQTNWSEIVEHYGGDPARNRFLPGMSHALHDLREAGVKKSYLGGSFVTAKPVPNDFDITFKGALPKTIPRAYAQVFNDRNLMKSAYGGECLEDHLQYFMHARNREDGIGILEIDMNSLPPRSEKSPAYSVYESWRKDNAKRITFMDRLNSPGKPPQEEFYTFSGLF